MIKKFIAAYVHKNEIYALKLFHILANIVTKKTFMSLSQYSFHIDYFSESSCFIRDFYPAKTTALGGTRLNNKTKSNNQQLLNEINHDIEK